jgi:hypothetical protein
MVGGNCLLVTDFGGDGVVFEVREMAVIENVTPSVYFGYWMSIILKHNQ